MSSRVVVRSVAVFGVVLLLIALGVSSVAAESTALGGKLRSGDTVIVPASETVGSDLYVFARTVTMNGTVHGDLVAAGGTIQVGGTVDGDVIVAGGTVEITGSVGGAIRAGGGQLTIGGDVKHDVLAGGGTLVLASGGHVGGDLIFAAGQATLDGGVTGGIQGQAGSYSRTGSVGGTEAVTVRPPVAAAPESAAGLIFDALRQWLVVVLFGALGLWLMPRGLRAAAEAVRRRPLLALGSGLLIALAYVVLLLVLLVVMIVLAITFGLLTFGSLVAVDVVAWLLASGGLTFAFLLAAAFLADAIVGLALGRLVLPAAAASRWRELAVLAAGAAAVVIVTSLPLVGPWAKLVVVLLGLGALALVGWAAWRARRTAAVAQPLSPSAPMPA
ncbi:MAG: hypothetical protein ACXWPO_10420 [Candidatus Limnocylindrales bacterium]